MADRPHILILGGTGEALSLATAAAGRARVTYSLAGRTQSPALPAGVAVRVGGFGGADALADWIREAAVDAVVDATHPFAAQIAANARTACDAANVPRIKLVRPAWTRHIDDDWREVPDSNAAAVALGGLGRRVFLSVGRQDLAAFAGLAEKTVLLRTAEPLEDLPLPGALCIVGRGPFTLARERALLRTHLIDVVVSRNAGGEATYAKIVAAREIGLPVIMIARPAPPPGPVAETPEDILDWIARLAP